MSKQSLINGDEHGRVVNLAANATQLSDAEGRLKNRLAQQRVPTTQNQSYNWVDWDNMRDFLGQPFDARKVPLSKLEQMRRDSMLAFGLFFVKIPLIRAPWYIKSSDAQRAAFIDNALRRIWGRFVLSYGNSFDYGFSAIVKRFEYDTPDWTYINPDDIGIAEDDPAQVAGELPVWPDQNVQALVWKPFMALNPKIAIPHWNASGEFAGIDYSPGGQVGAFGFSGSAGFPGGTGSIVAGRAGVPANIPLDWALWATNEKDSVHGSLWGYPRLSYAFRYWWSYWYKFGLADRAFEKWADPPVYVYHPSDSAVDENGQTVDYGSAALAVAEQLRSGANIAIPSDVVQSDLMDRLAHFRKWEVGQLESHANFDALNKSFEYLDVLKLRSMMVPEQSVIEGGGGTSSRNVAAVMGDLFQESQAAVMMEIDDVVNRYMIPQLLEANFGPGGAACTKVTTGFDPQDLETMQAIVQGVANIDPTNLPVDLRATLRQLGVPLLTHTAFQKILQQKADQAAAQQAAQKEPVSGGANTGEAGVTKTGLYQEPQQLIVVPEHDAPAPREPQEIHVHLPETKPPSVHLEMGSPEVHVHPNEINVPAQDNSVLEEMMERFGERPEPPVINVNVPEQTPPQVDVHVAAAEAPVVNVHVPEQKESTINVEVTPADVKIIPAEIQADLSQKVTIERDDQGFIKSLIINEVEEETDDGRSETTE